MGEDKALMTHQGGRNDDLLKLNVALTGGVGAGEQIRQESREDDHVL